MDTSRPELRQKHCDKHGPYEARVLFRDHTTGCPECALELERAVAERRAEQEQREREERAAARLAYHLDNSGLIGRFRHSTFATFKANTAEQRRVLTDVRSFAESFDPQAGGGLWLIGPPGTGKTHLGSAMVSHVIRERGLGAAIHGVHEIMAMLRERWGARDGQRNPWESQTPVTTDELIEHLGSIPLLVLDEIGVTRGTDHELLQLFAIVDQRYRLELPTVVLSNLKPEEMKPVLGDRVYDRLREGARMLVCKWPSHRGTKPQPETT